MPIHRVKGGWRWGGHGKTYPNRKGAERQAAAAYANGFRESLERKIEELKELMNEFDESRETPSNF